MPKPQFWNNSKRYYDLKTFFVNRFGCKVYKLQIDAGFTCPNRDGTVARGGCIYCDGRFSRLRQQGPLPSVAEQITNGKAFYRGKRGAQKFIAYFQTATNTYAPLEKLRALYDEALLQDDIVGISVGTRPDCVPDEVLDLFEEYARDRHVWLEYGLQSIHNRTLERINRGHDFETFLDSVDRTAGRDINICVHIILGLPGETREDIMQTAKALAFLPIQGIKIHLLLALSGTPLGDLYKRGEVRMMTKEGYASTVCDILEILPPEVVIQRLTADGYRDIYLAPDWGTNKMAVLNAIDGELERRNSWQGKLRTTIYP
ncbi:MAG: TIGR01212 family radical SAM protein [Deltaproteobacteria bacterium]|nr:TIGR01212 family radical SAM protein [Deltaproteobacteria bacterium]